MYIYRICEHGYQYSGYYTYSTIQDIKLLYFIRIASVAWPSKKKQILCCHYNSFYSSILPNNMHTLEYSAFKSLQLLVNRENYEQITNVIIKLYKDKLQLAKTRNTYEITNPKILWFLNASRCRQWLILVCFIYKKAFKLFSNLANCCDHCIYNNINTSQVPEFDLHNIPARPAIMYERTLKYLKLQFSAKRDYLCIIN